MAYEQRTASAARRLGVVDLASKAAAAHGLGLCIAIAACAQVVGTLVPVVGPPLFAIFFGVAITNLYGAYRGELRIGGITKIALQCGIVLVGGALNLRDVLRTGVGSILLLAFTIFAGFAAAFWGGARVSVSWRLRCLIGIGTTICGASAIAALAPVIRAKADEIAYSISVVFLLNMVAVVLFPVVGHALAWSDHGFGQWAGTAINDTSAVVAAGFAYSHEAGTYATVVKLTRTTLILPLVVAFGFITDKIDPAPGGSALPLLARIKHSVPWFIGLFLAASLLNTMGIVGRFAPEIQLAGRLVLLLALAGVGLQSHWGSFARTGPRPILLGVLTWAAVALSSLAIQTWIGQL